MSSLLVIASHVGISDRLVNYCPYNLLSGLLSPSPPFPVRISILYTLIQCVRGGGEYGVIGGEGP
jgi:hypothetical protein